jgi:2-polyprenyl-6-methoxyphenol hydroxylase-like FAD-dependent oxidoreductase
MEHQASAAKQAVVIGGSLGGLFAGLLLRSIGWDVDIYERSPHDLDSRGGGIVLQPEVLEAFRRAGVHYDTSIGVEAKKRVFLDRSGGLARRLPMRQMLTSWTSLYGAMRRHFPAEHYHQSAELTDFGQSAERVEARFADGREVTGGLLVAADGGGSFVRRRLMPEVRADYAGYVAWRGLVDEPELADEAAALLRDRFSFFEYANSHMLAYLVPGELEAIEPGKRASSIPPGLLSAASETDLREAAARHLPPAYRALVAATRAPFLQTIQDLSVRRMAVGRIALVGDAAFIPRPHTAASTAKAAGNALALVDALQRETDTPAALRDWEPDQIQFGLHLRRQGKLLGDQSQKRYAEPRPT